MFSWMQRWDFLKLEFLCWLASLKLNSMGENDEGKASTICQRCGQDNGAVRMKVLGHLHDVELLQITI